MSTLCFILGDQLSDSLPSIKAIDKEKDLILMCEVIEEASYVKHHPKKIALIFSAMRHFCKALKQENYRVRYIRLDDEYNRGSFNGELERAITEESVERVVLTEPSEWRVKQKIGSWKQKYGVPFEVLKDSRFLCSIDEFKQFASGRKEIRLEFFYRYIRKKYRILMNKDDSPVGGQWNYDKENRKPPKVNMSFPESFSHQPDEITKEVLKLVQQNFSENFGDLEGFNFAVTRQMALNEAKHFIEHTLPLFGNYQDAMVVDEPFLYHSRLSFYINLGLLEPLELCEMAESAYIHKTAKINAVEGFIRQILGWREFVRGVYWLHMPEYHQKNYLNANRRLPALYWGGKTQMFCLSQVVGFTKKHAYSHHIQRLMITGNFALLAGISPIEVCEWYLAVYADAFEWVELPNTLGMALYGDGGIMASKPYAASGKYIHRMSNFCKSCHYNPNDMLGDKACPFNALYWDFIDRNQKKLKGNQRLKFVFANWDKKNEQDKISIREKAVQIFKGMDNDKL